MSSARWLRLIKVLVKRTLHCRTLGATASRLRISSGSLALAFSLSSSGAHYVAPRTSDGILSLQSERLVFGLHRSPHRIKKYHFQQRGLIGNAQSTQLNGFEGSVLMSTKEVQNFNCMDVPHQRSDNPIHSKRHPDGRSNGCVPLR